MPVNFSNLLLIKVKKKKSTPNFVVTKLYHSCIFSHVIKPVLMSGEQAYFVFILLMALPG